MSEPKKKGRNKEPGVRKAEVSIPMPEDNSPMLPFDGLRAGSAQHNNEDPEIKERPTANHKLQTELMEVHHHPEVEKKGFKEYLLEGLMIFLAVFMGFVAENIRERISDHEHERQYMESLVKDLAADTTNLKIGFPMKDQRLKAIDSVFLFFETHPGVKVITSDAYRQMRRATWDRLYIRNTGTINQLRNSGGLRLIRKQNVRDSLASYDWLWDRFAYYSDMYQNNQHNEEALLEKMLDGNDLVHAYRINQKTSLQNKVLATSTTIRIDPVYVSEWLNMLNWQKIITLQDERRYKDLEIKAAGLSRMIKNEYDLKDE